MWMENWKELMGILSVLLFCGSYIPYFYSIWRGITKPHPYSWTAWGLLLGLIYFIQVSEKGGPGAWGIAAVALLQLAVAAVGWWRRADIEIMSLDVVAFTGAGVAMLLWLGADNPLAAVILIAAIDVLGYVPTFRKTLVAPYSENLLAYAIGAAAMLASLFGLTTLNATTVTEPIAFLIMQMLFVTVIAARRRKLI